MPSMIRVLLLAACLALPMTAAAVPIVFEIDSGSPAATTNGSRGGTSSAFGILRGDLEDGILSDVSGDLLIRYIGRVNVVDGMFDFRGDKDSWFQAERVGSFDVAQAAFDGQRLLFWASQTQCGNWGCKRHWLRFRGKVDPNDPTIPEPSAALLFGLGTVVVSRRVRGC